MTDSASKKQQTGKDAGRPAGANVPWTDVTEQKRLNDAREQGIPWKKWGPYLANASGARCARTTAPDGDAWEYFPHDHAR